MFAFYLALVIGAGIAVVYLFLVLEGFNRARREYDVGAAPGAEAETDGYERQARGFSWVAGIGVVVSTTLLALVSVWPGSWYLLPGLGLGSALAVVIAFLADRGDLNRFINRHTEEVRNQ